MPIICVMTNVNQQVKTLLENTDLTQKQIGDHIGVSQTTISDLYTGEQVDIGIERGGRKLEALYKLYFPDEESQEQKAVNQ